jgi:hypothetical protein
MEERDIKYLNVLIAQAKKKAKEKYGVEITREIKIDPNKSLEENKIAILQTIKEEVEERKKVLSIKKQKREESVSPEEKKKQMEELEKLINEANKRIVCDKDITKHYENLRNSIERLVKGYINCVFVNGRAGTGKSYQVLAKLNEMGLEPNKDYIEFSGEMSSAYVYRFLYENNGKILIFRDLINLLTNLRSLELLKTATETREPRIVRKGNYSKETEDLPDYFECKSKFIFEFNSLRYDGLKEDIEALLSRGDYIVLNLSFDEIADIMLKIAKEDWQKEVTIFLLQNYKFVGLNALNLRTQQKAFGIYKWCQETGRDWKQEVEKYLASEMSPIRRTLYTYIGDKIVKSSELKKILVLAHIDGVNSMRSADRRIRDWILMNELYIVGFVSYDEEELEDFLNSHRNYYVSLNRVEKIEGEKLIIQKSVEREQKEVGVDTTPQKSVEEIKAEAEAWRESQE